MISRAARQPDQAAERRAVHHGAAALLLHLNLTVPSEMASSRAMCLFDKPCAT
jgi:hypothetical protein